MLESQSPLRADAPGRAAALAVAASCAAAYFLAGWIGVATRVPGSPVTLLWLGSGLAFWAVYRLGERAAPVGILIGAIGFGLFQTGSVAFSLAAACGSVAAALLSARILRRAGGLEPFLGAAGPTLRFLAVPVLLATTVSGAVGAAALAAAGMIPAAEIAHVGAEWWAGDAMGVFLVAPALLTAQEFAGLLRDRRRLMELAAVVAVLLAFAGMAFWAGSMSSALQNVLAVMTVPPVLWAALRLGRAAAAWSFLLLAVVAAGATVAGVGPFIAADPHESLAVLYAYLTLSGLAAMALSVVGSNLTDTTEKLRAANELYAIAGAQVGIWDWNLRTGQSWFSEQIHTMLGYAGDEFRALVRETILPIVHPDDREALKAGLREQFGLGREAYFQELRVRTRDRGYRWVSTSGKLIVDGRGKPARMAGLVIDIDDRVAAEAAVRLSETRYRTLVEMLPAAVLVFKDAKVTSANAAACRLFGTADPGALIGLTRNELVHPDEQAVAAARYESRMAGRVPDQPFIDRRFKRLDGSEFVGEVGGTAIPDTGELMVTIRDVTEERRTSARLTETEARLRDALDSMSDHVFLWDSSDRLVMSNRGGGEWPSQALRIPPPGIAYRDEVRERIRLGLIPLAGDRLEKFAAARIRHHESATGRPMEYGFDDGSWIEYRDRRTKEGGVVTVLRNITERKRQERLREAERKALAAIATDSPLGQVLELLCRASEDLAPRFVCSILLMDRDGTRLLPGAAPSLPHGYEPARHGLRIGPAAGSCGTAAYRRERVVVADIVGDPLWRGCSAPALAHGLRSCWSTPLFGGEGRVVGTFALYGRETGAPSDAEVDAIEHLTRVAEVAIERRQAHDDLKDTAERLRVANERYAIAGAEAGIWDWDIRADTHFLSRRAAEMLGFDEAEFVGKTRAGLEPLLHPDDRERFRQGVRDRLAGGPGSFGQVVRLTTKLDGYLWVSLSGKTISGPDGAPARLAALLSDISDLKQAEEAVRRSEERYRTLMEFLPTAVLTLKGGLVTSANAEACRLFGARDADELRGLSRAEFVHPDELAASAERTRNIYAVGGSLPFVDRRYLTRDGRDFVGEVGATVIRREDGDEAMIAIRDVTEIRAMAGRVAAAEARLHDAIDSLSDGFLLWDREDRLVLVNEAHVDQERGMVAPVLAPGPTYSEMLRARVYAGLIPEAVGREEHYLERRIARHRDPSDEPLEMRVADGRWFEIRERRTNDGGVVSLRRDITARKRAQSLVEIERAILELVASNAPLPEILAALCRAGEQQSPHLRYSVLLVDADGMNLRHGAAPSLPEEYTTALGAVPIGPLSGCCGAAAFLRQSVGSPDIASDRKWEAWRDKAIECDLRACWSTPLLGAEGQVLGTFAIYDGVAREPAADEIELVKHLARVAAIAIERRQAQEELRESRERLDAIMENTVDGLVTIDERGVIETFSGPAERIFGYTAAEAIGRNVSILMPEPYRSAHNGYLARHLSTGAKRIIGVGREVVGLRKDGSSFPMDLAVGEIGAVRTGRRFVGTVRDITERKATEAELRQAQKMQAVGQLTGGVAHDFNNLLAVVMSNVELVTEHASIEPAVRRSLDAVLRATRRGAELTRRLLAFSSRQPLSPKRVDVNRLVQDLTELLTRTLGETVRMETHLAADLADATIDPGQLENAIVNLALNARDAMPGGGLLTIETANLTVAGETQLPEAGQDGLAPGRYVRIVVRDDGAGMPPEVAARAFEPFFTTKPKGKGSGLGLSMVYGFVKQSGGRLALETAPGRGTTLTLDLPAVDAASSATFAAPDLASPRQTGGTILVVEDDPDVRDTVLQQVRMLGYQARAAADGPAAMQALASAEPFDLVLSDVVLPNGMSGVDVAERARAVRPGLRFVFMSGYTDGEGNEARIRALGERLLMKPFGSGDLAQALAAAREGRRPA